jgi:hypothetical protein
MSYDPETEDPTNDEVYTFAEALLGRQRRATSR